MPEIGQMWAGNPFQETQKEGRREVEGECFDSNPGLLEGPKLSNSESEHERTSVCFMGLGPVNTRKLPSLALV